MSRLRNRTKEGGRWLGRRHKRFFWVVHFGLGNLMNKIMNTINFGLAHLALRTDSQGDPKRGGAKSDGQHVGDGGGQALLKNSKWQKQANKSMKQAFDTFMKNIEELEESTEEDIDKLMELMTKAPRNVQDPIVSQWGTIVASCAEFIDNCIVNYFFAVALKTHGESDKYLSQLACALLSFKGHSKNA